MRDTRHPDVKGPLMARARPGLEQLTRGQRIRIAAGILARSLVVVVLLFVGYYVLPMDRPAGGGLVVLVVGLLALTAVLAGQVRAIVRSPFPRLRAFEALAMGVPLLLVVFASSYYLMSQGRLDSFTQPLGKTDALYFTVTVFATVGFGDIAASTELARIAVTVNMLVNLVVLGFVAKLIFNAAETGVRRQATTPPGAPEVAP